MNTENTYLVSLTGDELILLDGKCREEIQKKVERAKLAKSLNTGNKIADYCIAKGAESGAISIYRASGLTHCVSCGKYADHPVYQRGPKKGKTNYNKPRVKFYGVRSAKDWCYDCEQKHDISKTITDKIKSDDLKIEIKGMYSKETRYKIDPKLKCLKCGEDSWESEYGKLPAMIQGSYAGKCPKCGAESLPFWKSHKKQNEQRHIKVNQ